VVASSASEFVAAAWSFESVHEREKSHMKRRSSHQGRRAPLVLASLAGVALAQAAAAQTVFYAENFDSAVLDQLSGDPRVINACSGNVPVFTHTPPAGWSWNACGIASFACRNTGTCTPTPPQCGSTCTNNEGVFEWEGWSFANKDFWVRVAGDQNRSQFTLGQGNVAVADPDEWDDRGDPDARCGFYSAFTSTPAISLANANLASLSLAFDSSWRPEGFDDVDGTNNQTATIRAIYRVGGVDQTPIEVLRWDSDDQGIEPGEFFKPDATNETVILDGAALQAPAGAQSVRFEFGLSDAGNDWWWAVDNLVVNALVSGNPTNIFTENFEGVTLEPPVHEVPSGCGVNYCGELTYTHNAPNGGSVSVASPATGGVPDWRGWSFVERAFWACASGGPNGSAFTNSSGLVAVADGDEFDDLASSGGGLDTTFTTPSIDISGRTDDILVLSFDSSWRWESPQTASVIATYNDAGNTQVEIINWNSDQSSPNFKPDAVNERLARALVVPAGATQVTLAFRYSGGNNWWWAIDNLSVFEGVATVTVGANTPSQNVMAVANTTDYAPCFTPWSPSGPDGWSSTFDTLGTCPSECGRPEWRGWAFANKDWWWQQVDNQERDQFTRARGYIAIADPDEWDDFPNGRSNYNAFMTSPSITLPNSITSASFNFDSSWRYEGFDDTCACDGIDPNTGLPFPPSNNQTATIRAIYTVGGVEQSPVQILRWDSDDGSNSGTGTPSAFFKPDNTNEGVSLPRPALQIPAGAQSVRFEFGLSNARNDWWWAVDNLDLIVNGTSRYSEGFESPTNLKAPPTENTPVQQCLYFSSVTAQSGNLTVDNTGLINCSVGDDFYGFNAWLTDAWARANGGARTQFGTETSYVSDFAARGCDGTARLITPAYSIVGINTGTLELTFRSSWGSEAGHVSTIEVSYDNGTTWTNVLTWNTSNKTTTGDEALTIALNNPAGASTARLRFSDAESGWWAFSELAVTGEVGTTCRPDFNGDGFLDFFDYDDYVNCFETGTCPPGKSADFNGDNFVDFFDYDAFVAGFEAGC
jgi:hypothetical protein